ncbi:MAG: exo-alpha-sialidase [Bacteroidales bacterium]|nr:exo-alpha-sialidase [Bacteroidales bacterium]
MKTRIFIICCLIGLISSCEKNPDPSYQNLEDYRFNKSGSDQKAFACNYLNDSISVQIENLVTNSCSKGLQVQFNVLTGGGSVDQSTVISDNNGFAYTDWKLGEGTCRQLVRANVLDYTGKLLSEIDFSAFGFRYNTWDTVTTRPDIRISDMVADTINNFTLMTSSSTLYKQGDNYFEWEEIYNIDHIHTIEIDNEGTLYAGTWYGELFKSTDQGETWLTCTNPIPDYTGPFELFVTYDNYIWVTRWDHGIRGSGDGGLTWTKDTIGLDTQEQMNDVYRLSNGTLLSLSLNKLAILRSEDDGKTWTPFNTPQYSLKIFVTENDEIIACNQDYGFSIYKSTDLGGTYIRKYSCSPKLGTSPMKHFFHKYGGIYYVMVPGYGILKTPDFESFEVYWRNNALKYLFMDHNGVFIARDWERDKVYYRKNTK